MFRFPFFPAVKYGDITRRWSEPTGIHERANIREYTIAQGGSAIGQGTAMEYETKIASCAAGARSN